MAFNAKIIEAGLNAAVGAAANGNLELMGQLDILPAEEIFLVNFLCQCLGVIVSVYAGGTLTGCHRADFGAGSAKKQAFFRSQLLYGFDVFISNSGKLHGHTAGKGHFSVAVFLCTFCCFCQLLCGDHTISGQNSAGEALRSAIPQKAHCLYPGDVRLLQFCHFSIDLFLSLRSGPYFVWYYFTICFLICILVK